MAQAEVEVMAREEVMVEMAGLVRTCRPIQRLVSRCHLSAAKAQGKHCRQWSNIHLLCDDLKVVSGMAACHFLPVRDILGMARFCCARRVHT